MANFTGKQKKLLAAGSAAAVLVLVLGIAVFTLGGGNAETPPAAPQGSQPDVAVSGILLTGGGSLLQGMDTLLAARTGMETHLAEDPIRAVALGLEQTLPHLAKRQEGVLNLARRRQLTV